MEDQFVRRILAAQSDLSVGQAQNMLRRWFVEDFGPTQVRHLCGGISNFFFNLFFSLIQAYVWDNNEEVVTWLQKQANAESTVNKNIYSVKRDAVISQIQKSLEVRVRKKN